MTLSTDDARASLDRLAETMLAELPTSDQKDDAFIHIERVYGELSALANTLDPAFYNP